MKQVILGLILAGMAFASSPFHTICANTVGGKTVEVEAGLGMTFTTAGMDGVSGMTMDLPRLVATYGINDKFDVGFSLLNIGGIQTGDLEGDSDREPMALHAKFAILPEMLAVAVDMPLNFTVEDGEGFDMTMTAALSLVEMLNINLGFNMDKENSDADMVGTFQWGLSVVPSFGDFFAGAEINMSLNGDITDAEAVGENTLWRFGVGYNITESMGISLGFGGNFESNNAMNLGLGFSMSFGGN
jgi:hypothetical protein